MDSFEDGALVTDVARGGETQTANETGAHVGQNITVEVGHDQDLVAVRGRVGGDLQASIVQKLGVEFNVGEIFGDISGGAQEETVGHLHDGGFVNNTDLLLVDITSILECVSQDPLGSSSCDELDRLDDSVNDNMFDATVFSFGIFSNQDGVDIVVGSLVALDASAGTDVCKEVECASEGQVERDMAFADGGGERALEGNVVLVDGLDRFVWNDGPAVLETRGDVDRLPLDWHASSRVDVLDGLRNLRPNTITLY